QRSGGPESRADGTLGEPHRVDRREVVPEALPLLAPVRREEDVPRRRAEGERVALRVERVAVDEVVAILLREAVAEVLPRAAAVLGPADDEPPVDGVAVLVARGRDDPRRLRVARRGRDREAE